MKLYLILEEYNQFHSSIQFLSSCLYNWYHTSDIFGHIKHKQEWSAMLWVFSWICAHIWWYRFIRVRLCTELPSLSFFAFFFKAELTDCLGLAGQWTPGICLSPSAQHWGHSYGVTGFYISTANPNSGPCIWATVSLPTNLPSPDRQLHYCESTSAARRNICKHTLLCGDLWDQALNHKKKQENERLASLRNSNSLCKNLSLVN